MMEASKHQVKFAQLKRPCCIASIYHQDFATFTSEVDAVRCQLEKAEIIFAAMAHEPEVSIYVERTDVQLAMAAGVKVEYCPDQVVVKDGKVVRVEHWVNWNGTLWPTIVIERKTSGFRGDMGDPEHGGGHIEGTLDEVLFGLHPKIQAPFRSLFELQAPTEEIILEQPDYKDSAVVFQ